MQSFSWTPVNTFYGFIYCEVQQCLMKSAIITKKLQLPSKTYFSHTVPLHCWCPTGHKDELGKCWLGYPVLCSTFVLIPLLAVLYPRESCPLLEPSASFAHPHVLQSLAQSCDRIHSEVFFSVDVSKNIISFYFFLCLWCVSWGNLEVAPHPILQVFDHLRASPLFLR